MKKLGDSFAKEMFRKGLDELRELGHFSGGNVAQPNIHTLGTDAEQGQETAKPETTHAQEIERER